MTFNEANLPIIGGERKLDPEAKIEICRSYSYNLSNQWYKGGKQYESASFFASRKMECAVSAAPWVSEQLFEECVAECRAAALSHIRRLAEKGGY